MRRLIFAIFLLCLFAWNTAEAGVLRTRDGRVFEGTLRFETAGWVQVVPKSQNEFPLSFKLADIAALTLRTPLSGVVSGGTLPGNWGVQDLGATSTVGSADYAAGEFTLRGEGTALGSITDACHFVYHRLPSDGQLIARVQEFSARDSDTADLNPQAVAGLMLRQTLDPSDRFCALAITAAEGPKFFTRAAFDAPAIAVSPAVKSIAKAPYWLKLVRTADRILAAMSPDGKKWEFLGEFKIGGPGEVFIGLFTASNRAGQLATAVFDHVRLTINGLQAEYFADAQFEDLRVTRIDPQIDFNWIGQTPNPAIPRENFSVRWTGQLRAPATDTYHFALAADTAARLYINKQIVVDTRSRVQRTGNINLVGDKSYEIRVDYYNGTGNAACRLMWASQTQPEIVVVPTESLFYSPPMTAQSPTSAPTSIAQSLPTASGIRLSDGSFLPGSITSASNQSVAFSYRNHQPIDISADKVAWLILHPLSAAMQNKMPAKGAGLLTTAGDFVEGECQDLSGGRVKISSVVFGDNSFDVAQTTAIVYRDPTTPPARWIIHTTSGGTIRATSFHADKDSLILDQPLLGSFSVKPSEITEITTANR
jgi:hypothetical protein